MFFCFFCLFYTPSPLAPSPLCTLMLLVEAVPIKLCSVTFCLMILLFCCGVVCYFNSVIVNGLARQVLPVTEPFKPMTEGSTSKSQIISQYKKELST